jgi:hypothetical protein
MSAAEIIEQIRALPREEQKQVANFVSSQISLSTDEPRMMDRATFDQAKNYVFENYGTLLKKLAE